MLWKGKWGAERTPAVAPGPLGVCRESVSSEVTRLPSELREAAEGVGILLIGCAFYRASRGGVWGLELWGAGQIGGYTELCGNEF